MQHSAIEVKKVAFARRSRSPYALPQRFSLAASAEHVSWLLSKPCSHVYREIDQKYTSGRTGSNGAARTAAARRACAGYARAYLQAFFYSSVEASARIQRNWSRAAPLQQVCRARAGGAAAAPRRRRVELLNGASDSRGCSNRDCSWPWCSPDWQSGGAAVQRAAAARAFARCKLFFSPEAYI